MKRLIFLSLGLLLLLTTTSSAQNRYIDGLEQRLRTKNIAVDEVVALHQQLADWYRTNEQYPLATQHAENSLKLTKSGKNMELSKTKAYVLLSNIAVNQEEYEQARNHIDTAFTVARTGHDSRALGYAFYAEATLNETLYENEKTVKNLQAALRQIKDLKAEALLVSRIYYRLYSIYSEQNDLKNSSNYANKAVEYAIISGNKNQLSNCYLAQAVVYTYRYDTSKHKADLDSVINLAEKAAAVYHKYPEQVAFNTYCIARVNKANYYLKYYPATDLKIKQAIRDNLNEALAVAKHVSSSPPVVASCYGILSELALRDNDLKGAEKYLLQAYTLMQVQKVPYYHTLINVVNGLASVYAESGDYKKAFSFQQKVNEYSGLLFDESQAQHTKRLEAQYQADKRSRELVVLTENAKSLQREKWLYIGLGIIALVGAFFMFRSYDYRLKYSLAREGKLKIEKQEAELQTKLHKEEQERLKAEQQLLTFQQQQLQKEAMAGALHIEHKNEVLQNLKNRLAENETVNIHKILREENLLDADFEKAIYRIKEINPGFFKTLNEKAQQKLTPLDLKYCTYIHLDMDTKQIATLLSVEPKSVRMTKYRLKQKLNLDKDEELGDYLRRMG
ncbi:hypothetical protein [Dyadobacter sp. CY312]|uniref:helix-turn-helix transcriptional regulator n=1 Tax=Dyadobacter sp. CY312 TaxID=2907303 RepID=UPI001F20DDE1|nr:hypothetical protein [Dyadobacter sp. CY312]MCE7040150.1 hypothetical protein [Dyadobacter sp. CY312]